MPKKNIPAIVKRRKREDVLVAVYVTPPLMESPAVAVPPMPPQNPASSARSSTQFRSPASAIQMAQSEQAIVARQNVSAPPARICVELDGKIVKEVHLDKPLLTVGRSQDCDIFVSQHQVSRRHAVIRLEGGAWLIEDAQSANGMAYQGRRIKCLVLDHGCKIYLAPNVALLYENLS
jgi:hypothetical protein